MSVTDVGALARFISILAGGGQLDAFDLAELGEVMLRNRAYVSIQDRVDEADEGAALQRQIDELQRRMDELPVE